MILLRIVLLAMIALMAFPNLGNTQDRPLDGTVKSILIGTWVKVDEPAGLTVELALERCSELMVPEDYLNAPGRRSHVDELPQWKSLKGDFAFFEHGENLYGAGPTMIGYSAALYEYPRMISENSRALIIGINTWNHNPNSGFSRTPDGSVLVQTPIQLAIQNGLVFTKQFLLQIGQRNENAIALLLTNVTRNGERTSGSIEYVRCGDISEILNP